MIKSGRDALARDYAWLGERNNKLLEAEAKLHTAFAKYVGNCHNCEARRRLSHKSNAHFFTTQAPQNEYTNERIQSHDLRRLHRCLQVTDPAA